MIIDDLSKQLIKTYKKYIDDLPIDKKMNLDSYLDEGENVVRDYFISELKMFYPDKPRDYFLDYACKATREIMIYGIDAAKRSKSSSVKKNK